MGIDKDGHSYIIKENCKCGSKEVPSCPHCKKTKQALLEESVTNDIHPTRS